MMVGGLSMKSYSSLAPSHPPVHSHSLSLSLSHSRMSSPSSSSSSHRHFNKHLVSDGKPNHRRHHHGRVFFLDVNPICYSGSHPSLRSFARWLSLFFSQVSRAHPVIAVLDGEEANEYRRKLLPSYKAHRRKAFGQLTALRPEVADVLRNCNVPVVKVDGYEADDVVATLTDQVLQKGFRVVIGSPDKDFKQLISGEVQLVMPMPEFGRWSFYTLRHYIDQYNCDPSSDLSFRCIMGDEVDGVPGIQHLAPGFGRKTALKLLKKHGSLENLLNAAAIRTVGKHYAQNALTKYADYLRKNYEVLSLRRDANIQLEEEWLSKRDTCNDSAVLSSFVKKLDETQKLDNRIWIWMHVNLISHIVACGYSFRSMEKTNRLKKNLIGPVIVSTEKANVLQQYLITSCHHIVQQMLRSLSCLINKCPANLPFLKQIPICRSWYFQGC